MNKYKKKNSCNLIFSINTSHNGYKIISHSRMYNVNKRMYYLDISHAFPSFNLVISASIYPKFKENLKTIN